MREHLPVKSAMVENSTWIRESGVWSQDVLTVSLASFSGTKFRSEFRGSSPHTLFSFSYSEHLSPGSEVCWKIPGETYS